MNTEPIRSALTWKQAFSLLTLPYVRRELPGWGKLLRAAGVFNHEQWHDAPVQRIRGRWHGYDMDLHLANWSERHTFFLGRFYDLETQLLLLSSLKQGDTFIDVGANIGMMTLLASHLVGPDGNVISFEPNPVAAARLQETLQLNGIRNVALHQAALGNEKSHSRLKVVTSHSGMGTLTNVPVELQDQISAEYDVNILRGTDVLPELPDRPVTIKLDVEGFELNALRGLEPLLAERKPLVMTEVIPCLLSRVGVSPEDLRAFMGHLGYQAFEILTSGRWLTRRLLLRQTTFRGSFAPNIAWLQATGPQTDRVRQWMDD